MEKYYGNIPCKILAEIEHESVIELLIGKIEFDGLCEEPPYVEPVYNKIIVNSNKLSNRPIGKQNILDEKDNIIKKAKEKAQKIICDANEETKEEYNTLKNTIKDIKKRVHAYKGLEQYLDFLDDKIQYVVFPPKTYRFGIKKIDELYCSYDKNNLASVIIRSKNNEISMYIGQYSDYSGSDYEVIPCKTLDEAKEIFTNFVLSYNFDRWSDAIVECKKWGITIDVVEKKSVEIENERIKKSKKEISNLEEKLERLKQEINGTF